MTYRSKLDSKRVIMYKGDIILKLVAVLAVVLVAVLVAVQVEVQVLLMLDRLNELLKIQINLALFELQYLDLHQVEEFHETFIKGKTVDNYLFHAC